jgi:hypothetical protein
VPPQQTPPSVFEQPSREVPEAVKAAAKEDNNRWTRWYAKAKQLRADLEVINQESTLLANYPGWSDMAQILKSYASIRHLEGEESAARKRAIALTQWSQKWQANGRAIYEKSRVLVNQIAVAEVTFQALEKEHQEIKILHAESLRQAGIALPYQPEKGSWGDVLVKFEDAMFDAPLRNMQSELFALLQKPLITLGFTEKGKP